MPVNLINLFEQSLDQFLPTGITKIAVAVSGGADSLCLAHLLIQQAKHKKITVYGFTVNHGFRREAKAEAQYVHTLFQKWGGNHQILSWRGKKPTTHVEEKARQARYDLLYQACQKHKIQYLFIAHHLEDQAETFWMRLAHGSGPNGLSAMELCGHYQGITLVRPLLNWSKSDIISYNQAHHIKWCEDPMNQDDAFERVQWRQRQELLTKWGLTPEMIYTLTQRLNCVKNALNLYTDSFIKNHLFISPAGYGFIQHIAWQMIPSAIQIQVLQKILPLFSGDDKIISLEGVESLIHDTRKNITFAGCHIIKNQQGLYFTKEYRTTLPHKKIPAKTWVHWDRFDIWSSHAQSLKLGTSQSYKNLPKAVQNAFINVDGGVHYSLNTSIGIGIYVSNMPIFTQKELEKKVQLDYNKREKITYIHFNPRKQV